MKRALTITAVLLIAAAMVMAQGKEDGRPMGGEKGERGMGMQGGRGMGMQGGRGGERGGRGGERGGPGGQHGDMMERMLSNPEIREKLGITDEQVAELKTDLQKMKEEMIDLQAEMQKVGLRQAEAMTAKDIDEGKLMDMVEDAGKLRTKMAKLQIKKMILFRKYVDPEKMEQVRGQLKERMRERFRERMGDRGGEGGQRGPGEGDQEQRRKKFEEMRRHRQGGDEGKEIKE